MLNQVVLVGRIKELGQVEELEGKKFVSLQLAVPRSFKNEKGEYDTDLVDITLWDSVATNVCEYCQKNDVVGVKGRIGRVNVEFPMTVIAEKVSFLSSRRNEE